MKFTKSTFSSNIWLSDAGHPVMRAYFVHAFFAATALKNEGDRTGISMNLAKNPSVDNLSLCSRLRQYSLLPYSLLLSFFFLQAKLCQVSEGQKGQEHMSVPTSPGSAFMMIQTKLFFQLLVSLFNPESFMKETNHLQGRHRLGHIAEMISQLKPTLVRSTSFYNQPDLFMKSSFSIPLGRPDPLGYRPQPPVASLDYLDAV